MLALCLAEGVAVLPWSPLARGRLARPWTPEPATERGQLDEWGIGLYAGTVDADRKIVDRVHEVSAARGISQAQTALAWLLSKPVVTAPIVGVTKPLHLSDALAALSVKLSDAEIEALETPYTPHPVAGF